MNLNTVIIFISLAFYLIFGFKKEKTEGSEKEFFGILKGTSLFLALIYIFVTITCFFENFA